MRGLQGKVVLVTGGRGDLGRASIVRLIEEGCRVASFDAEADADGALEKLGAFHQTVDITQDMAIERACGIIREKWGPVGVLVNTAARFIFKGVEATPEDWTDILSVNVTGTSLVTKHIFPQMKEAGGGSVINFSSISGFIGQANFSTYNATKFAIRGLTKCWAQDFAPYRIRVNTLCPGYVYTSAFVDSCTTLGLEIGEEDRRVSALHLLGRQGRPEEIAAAVAFLASDDSSFMTGSDLVVDGGYLAR